MAKVKNIYIVLGSYSLSYAGVCIETLFKNSLEDIKLILITDFKEDKIKIKKAIKRIKNPKKYQWGVFDKKEADIRAKKYYKGYKNILTFREGHPCWRKITDPILFAKDNEEIIILDPDIYFPNKFKFEETPKKGVLLMKQVSNCLLPIEIVEKAFKNNIKLADNTDIGVAQLNRNTINRLYLDNLIKKLGGENIPKEMHVESIIWAALAMRYRGGYLNPEKWVCWYARHWKRILIKFGFPTKYLLRLDNLMLKKAKCFHISGMAKFVAKESYEKKILKIYDNIVNRPSKVLPFKEFTKKDFENRKKILEKRKKSLYGKLIDPYKKVNLFHFLGSKKK
jgi:hypothetical protein